MIEQHLYDKSSWPRGEWDNEPDRISWIDKDTGYNCLMKRQKSHGAWCGYVAVTEDHPCYGKDYDFVRAAVHGGITYADKCKGEPDKGICHTEKQGEGPVWWFGFDCIHADDHAPVFAGRYGDIFTGQYRNVDYVKSQIKSFAKQLKELKELENERKRFN